MPRTKRGECRRRPGVSGHRAGFIRGVSGCQRAGPVPARVVLTGRRSSAAAGRSAGRPPWPRPAAEEAAARAARGPVDGGPAVPADGRGRVPDRTPSAAPRAGIAGPGQGSARSVTRLGPAAAGPALPPHRWAALADAGRGTCPKLPSLPPAWQQSPFRQPQRDRPRRRMRRSSAPRAADFLWVPRGPGSPHLLSSYDSASRAHAQRRANSGGVSPAGATAAMGITLPPRRRRPSTAGGPGPMRRQRGAATTPSLRRERRGPGRLRGSLGPGPAACRQVRFTNERSFADTSRRCRFRRS
jgi:hypothetical protein